MFEYNINLKKRGDVKVMLIPKNISTFSNTDTTYTIDVDTINLTKDFYNLEILFDDKAKDKFIKYIEKIVRSSIEYKTYIGFLKNELDLTRCTFLPQIDINEIEGISLEFHHYPFTLYDIVAIVVEKYTIEGDKKKLDPFRIADEVLKMHYENIIGLVPVSKTIHELIHSGGIFVPLSYVFGNFSKFLTRYDWKLKGISEKLTIIQDKSSNIEDGEKLNTTILDKKFMEVNIKDIERPKMIKVEEIRELA